MRDRPYVTLPCCCSCHTPLWSLVIVTPRVTHSSTSATGADGGGRLGHAESDRLPVVSRYIRFVVWWRRVTRARRATFSDPAWYVTASRWSWCVSLCMVYSCAEALLDAQLTLVWWLKLTSNLCSTFQRCSDFVASLSVSGSARKRCSVRLKFSW